MIPRATIDFESRSACSLRNCGSWHYSLDPTTDVLCLAYRLPYWTAGRTGLWHPAFPDVGIEEGENFEDLSELFEWVESRGLIEAHSAWFERGIWTNLMEPMGWPKIMHRQWRCSAAKAAAHALPRNLRDATKALKLDVLKDDAALRTALDLDGKTMRAMTKIGKPRKPLKKELVEWKRKHAPCVSCSSLGKKKVGRAKATTCVICAGNGYVIDSPHIPSFPRVYHESKDQLERVFQYCRQDVLAEEALSQSLPDLSPQETEIYLLDQQINQRGFALDPEAINSALLLIDGELATLNMELPKLTGGVVAKATQRAQMMGWLETRGVELDDTTKETVKDALTWVEEPSAHRALEILQQVGKSSTAKYLKMRDWQGSDGRVRGGLLYHGASTGRWSGSGIQPHNFVKGAIKDQDALWTLLKSQDAHRIVSEAPQTKTGTSVYTTVMDALSQGLRGVIIPGKDKQLYVADYSAIEARVLMWVAGEEEALEIFRRGEDIYCEMASRIYDRPITKANTQERQLGKATILGCGYQMGASKFVDTAAVYGVTITEEFAKVVVDTYREQYWRVKRLWREMEEAAIQAVYQHPQEWVGLGKVVWETVGDFLYCELPSGRKLAYPFPEVRPTITPWGEKRNQLTFMGIDTYTRKWTRQHTYGGSLCVEEGTDVLTHRGWVAIEEIQETDFLWDGVDWTTHGGVVCKGVQPVIDCDGIGLTGGHRVLTEEGWKDASSCHRLNRADVWLPYGIEICRKQRNEIIMEDPMCMRANQNPSSERTTAGASEILRLQTNRYALPTENSWDEQTSSVRSVAKYVRPVPTSNASSVEKLWGSWYQGLRYMAEWIRAFLGRHGTNISNRSNYRTSGQREGILARQLLLDDIKSTESEQTQYYPSQRNVPRSLCRQPGAITVNCVLPVSSRVFDILDCGPRRQFVVRNFDQSRCLIVHNCENIVQAIARDLMAEAILRLERGGVYAPILTVHDEVLAEAEIGAGSVGEFEQLLAECPVWASGCPVSAEGWVGTRYRK